METGPAMAMKSLLAPILWLAESLGQIPFPLAQHSGKIRPFLNLLGGLHEF